MINLLISVLFSLCIANLLKLYQLKSSINFLNIFLGNYFIATIFSIFQAKGFLGIILHWDILLAIINGILFLSAFYLFQKNIKENGISISVSAMRLALVIPTILSLIFFKEYLAFYKYLSIFVILLCIILLTNFRHRINAIYLFSLFCLSGMIDFSMKLFDVSGVNNSSSFLFILFLSAFISNLFIILVKRIRINRSDFVKGMVLGVPNQLTTVFFLKSLKTLPGTVAYPVHSSLIIIFSLLSDILIWKRKISIKQILIYGLLIISIGVMNIN